jgi:UDP-N-acetyl-D-mannosaminuronic acid dehydrogenase
VDPWFLVADFPEEARLIKQARITNDDKAKWCAKKVVEACLRFREEKGRKPVVACMGLAFKPDVDDLRESPAAYIAGRLLAEAPADVLVAEPNLGNHVDFTLTHYEDAYTQADIVVWLVRHRVFLQMPLDIYKTEIDFCGVRK